MKPYIIFFLIIIISYPVSSQSYWYVMKPNTVLVSGTFEGELSLNYERVFKYKNSFQIGVGYKFFSDTENAEVRTLSWSPDKAAWYKGNFFNLGYRRYFNEKKHPFYFLVQAFYKQYSFPKISVYYYKTLIGGQPTEVVKSGAKSVIGLKVLFGKKFTFRISDKVNFILDCYTGFGYRWIELNDFIYSEGDVYYPQNKVTFSPPKHEYDYGVGPSYHLGIMAGFAF